MLLRPVSIIEIVIVELAALGQKHRRGLGRILRPPHLPRSLLGAPQLLAPFQRRETRLRNVAGRGKVSSL